MSKNDKTRRLVPVTTSSNKKKSGAKGNFFQRRSPYNERKYFKSNASTTLHLKFKKKRVPSQLCSQPKKSSNGITKPNQNKDDCFARLDPALLFEIVIPPNAPFNSNEYLMNYHAKDRKSTVQVGMHEIDTYGSMDFWFNMENNDVKKPS